MTTSPTPLTDAAHRVVVGVDGSSASFAALQWAVDYASGRHMRVHAIIAWDWPTTYAWGSFPSDFNPGLSAEQMLDQLVERTRSRHPNVTIDGEVLQGDPTTILESASHDADLLVVAQRGHGELVGMLLGSVSEHCVTHAHCPVLVFRDDHTLSHQKARKR